MIPQVLVFEGVVVTVHVAGGELYAPVPRVLLPGGRGRQGPPAAHRLQGHADNQESVPEISAQQRSDAEAVQASSRGVLIFGLYIYAGQFLLCKENLLSRKASVLYLFQE